jgi:hypothetical protein
MKAGTKALIQSAVFVRTHCAEIRSHPDAHPAFTWDIRLLNSPRDRKADEEPQAG